MRKLTLLLIIITLFGCSPKIKSIVEYQKIGNDFLERKLTKFDKNGNKIREEGLGNERSNRITTTEFKNNKRVFEKNCDYFKSHDTCVIRDFSKFDFNSINNSDKQTLFESDSAIRFVRETKRLKNIEIQKVYSWEFFPVKNPKMEDALILIDTTYFDNEGRKIKQIHHNDRIKETWIELFKYHKSGYLLQTKGTSRDTIIEFTTNVLQKIADKKKLDYKFGSPENYKYKIEYY